MACPLFLPASPLGDFDNAWSGECAAQPGESLPADTLRNRCNRGYARGDCAFAASAEPDAFRFMIKSNRNGSIEVAWSSERNHHPLAVGTLIVDGAEAVREPLECQARACVTEYLRQTGK